MARLNLVSPWVEYYHKVQAFFRNDPDINVIFDDEEIELKIYVSNDVDKFDPIFFNVPPIEAEFFRKLKNLELLSLKLLLFLRIMKMYALMFRLVNADFIVPDLNLKPF